MAAHPPPRPNEMTDRRPPTGRLPARTQGRPSKLPREEMPQWQLSSPWPDPASSAELPHQVNRTARALSTAKAPKSASLPGLLTPQTIASKTGPGRRRLAPLTSPPGAPPSPCQGLGGHPCQRPHQLPGNVQPETPPRQSAEPDHFAHDPASGPVPDDTGRTSGRLSPVRLAREPLVDPALPTKCPALGHGSIIRRTTARRICARRGFLLAAGPDAMERQALCVYLGLPRQIRRCTVGGIAYPMG